MLLSNKVRILPLEKRHLEKLRKLRNDSTTWEWLTDVRPINEVGQEDWFEKMSRDSSRMYFAIEARDELFVAPGGQDNFVGMVRMDEWDKINDSIRIGVDIAKGARRQGYGYHVYELVVEYLFQQLNIHRIWFLVADNNLAALGLYKKFGFKEEGRYREALWRNGKWNDYIVMSLLEGEYEKV